MKTKYFQPKQWWSEQEKQHKQQIITQNIKNSKKNQSFIELPSMLSPDGLEPAFLKTCLFSGIWIALK